MLAKRRRMDMQCDPQWVLDLFSLLDDVLDEADDLLDRVNGLLSYAGSIADDETHGPAVTKARAMLGKESV